MGTAGPKSIKIHVKTLKIYSGTFYRLAGTHAKRWCNFSPVYYPDNENPSLTLSGKILMAKPPLQLDSKIHGCGCCCGCEWGCGCASGCACGLPHEKMSLIKRISSSMFGVSVTK